MVIDAAFIHRWRVDPQTVAPAESTLELDETGEEVKCLSKNVENDANLTMSFSDNEQSSMNILDANLCDGTLNVLLHHHVPCTEERTAVHQARYPLRVVAPPER